jgi:hypothetical protein
MKPGAGKIGVTWQAQYILVKAQDIPACSAIMRINKAD